MWLSRIALCLLPLASSSLVRFRTPSPRDGSFDVSNTSVSYLYVDIYKPPGLISHDPYGIVFSLYGNLCLIMDPAYSLARDRMTFYGTCDYRQMLRLELKQSRTNKSWKTRAEVCYVKKSCSRKNITDFHFIWQGINYTAEGQRKINA